MQYFYLDSTQQQCGSYSFDKLRLLAQEGKIPFNTLVAHDAAEKWVELSSLLEHQTRQHKPSLRDYQHSQLSCSLYYRYRALLYAFGDPSPLFHRVK